MPLLAELAERDATGEQGAIYAEIRRLGGVPMVALIFRHLATLPGALEWTWARGRARRGAPACCRRPRGASRARRRSRRSSPIPQAALAALGVDGATRAEHPHVLAAYNRANPENLLTVLCLLRLLAGVPRRERPLQARDGSRRRRRGRCCRWAMSRRWRRRWRHCSTSWRRPGDDGGPKVVQSLYRHFAHLPAFLSLAVTLLLARLATGRWQPPWRRFTAPCAAAADELVRAMDAPPCRIPALGPH